MQVEVFAQHEVAGEDETECHLAANIAERMGLAGQLQRRAAASTRAFAELTADQEIVFKHFCPRETPLESYGFDMIPLRVLEVAEQCRPHFEKMVVWHPMYASEKDPILLGCNKDSVHAWRTRYFPLARWGEVLDEWVAMVSAARDHLLRARKAELAAIAIEARGVLKYIDQNPGACTLQSLRQSLGCSPKSLIGG